MADLIEQNNQVFGNYYDRINNLILKTKQNVVKNINSEMVELYFEIGSTINELIENYNLEASQNEILKLFSEKLTREFGQGFSVPSLKKMKKFYLTYKGGSTLWNHSILYLQILPFVFLFLLLILLQLVNIIDILMQINSYYH